MEQHPVPQNISSYEFRLVGDMTLRQFAYLAAGVLVALTFYALPLAGFLKWPLVLTPAFIGFALAFMPIEERPLSTWVTSFFKAIISPTIFIWQKRPEKPEIFAPIIHLPALSTSSLGFADKSQLDKYLKTLPFKKPVSPVDEKEASYLKQVASLFQTVPTATHYPPVQLSPPPPPPFPSPVSFKEEAWAKSKPEVKKAAPAKPAFTLPLSDKPDKPSQPVVKAKLSSQLPIPTPPTRPNILVGMVLSNQGEIIEGAILEIRNSQGMPVRALRTNKLGQFLISTPLENSTYEIETEKEGHIFDIIKIEISGKIVKPIEIKAK